MPSTPIGSPRGGQWNRSDLGRAVIANAATQILVRQARRAIDPIAETFALTVARASFGSRLGHERRSWPSLELVPTARSANQLRR